MLETIKGVSGVFGKVNQIGMVVRSCEDSARKWSRLGIRPWYRGNTPEEGVVLYRGNETRLSVDIALGYMGDVQVELIEVKGKEPNIYTEHLERHGEGIHHLGFFVYGINKKAAVLEAAGIRPLQSGVIPSKGGAVTTYAYYDTAGYCGTILELIETKLVGIPLKMTRFMMRVGTLTGDASRMKL